VSSSSSSAWAPLYVMGPHNCPYCGGEDSDVHDSRSRPDGVQTRRRICRDCTRRFTTYESCLDPKRVKTRPTTTCRSPLDESR